MDLGSARPTLNDILLLEREHLHKGCPPDIRLMIAKEVSEWTLVGRYLGFSKQDLAVISRQYDTEDQRKVAMFDTWHEREGSNATYLRLADALYQYGRKDLIQWLCLIVMFEESGDIAVARTVPESKSEAMFRSNLEDIKSRFAFLLMKVWSALEANNVDPIDVHSVLVGIFDCGDCLPKTNLEEMFTAVTSQRFWDYTHHSPVEKLLRRFLPDHLSLIHKYKTHLSGFYTTTTLIDYITYTNVDSTADNKLDLERQTDANYRKLKVMLELDRKIDTLALKHVQELWEEFAEEFDIPNLTALIGKILSDRYLHITWLITPDTANKIATAARESSFFQNHPSIIYVAINDTVHYNEVARCKARFKQSLGKGIEEVDLHIPNDRHLANFINQNAKLDRVKRLDLATNGQTYTVTVNSKAKFRNITKFKPGHCAIADDIKHKLITGILYTLFIAGFVIGLIVGVFAGLKDANQMFYSSIAGAIAGAFTAPIYSVIKDDEEVKFDIDSTRLFSVRLLAVILASGLIGAIGNTNTWATMGAIGGAFVGNLIARVSGRAASFKYIAKATVFSISLGALIGTVIGALASGGTIPGTISGAITAGVVAIAFDDLEAIISTGTFGEMVKIVVQIIMILPRDDIIAIVVGIIIGAIMNNSPIVLGHGAVFGAVAGAIFATAKYIKHPNITNPTRFLYSIIVTFLGPLCLRYIKMVFGIGASGVVGGLLLAAFIGISLAHPPDNPVFDVFRYRTIFAAIAGLCAGAGVLVFLLPTYIISSICGLKVSFPELVGRPVIVAITGAVVGGYLLAAVVNMAGLRLVNRASTRFINWTISAIRGILRTVNVSIFLGAIGAVFGAIFAGTVESIVGEKLAGAVMGAILGAITGIASGAFTAIATAIIKNITIPAVTKMSTDQEIEILIVIATIGGFIGGVFGGYFTSNIVAGSLVALTFPIVTAVMYTAPLYAERRHRFKRVKRIPLVSVMNKFGIELRYLTDEEGQNNWLLYKIFKGPL